MKKIEKVFALLMSTIIASGTIGTFTADAVFQYTDNALSNPEGYTEYIDTEGIFGKSISENNDYAVYYKEVEDYSQTQFKLYSFYRYNHTVFNVVNAKIDEFDAIYEKYSEKLDMDSFLRGTPPSNLPDSDVEAVIYDMYDENGRNTKDPNAMTDKRRIIQEMAAEMYQNGCITKVHYNDVVAQSQFGYNNNTLIVDLNNGTTGEDTDTLTEIVSFCDSVTSIEYSEYYKAYAIRMCITETADAMSAIKAVYPDADGSSGAIYQMNTENVSNGTINLLTAIQEEESCDTNQSGAVDLDDAVQVLTHYANTAAGIAPAAETANMDVNGDGSVTLDDAVKVLTVYAELAAGLR